MTKTAAILVLDHNVEIRIPTQCGDCMKSLPEEIRVALLDDAKCDFGKWFGGFEVTHKHGGYTFPDGTLAEEEVDVVSANCSADALEEHMEDLAVFAVRVANELSQDSVALSIDGRMRFYDRTPDAGKCRHAKKGKAVAMPLSVPKGRKAKTDLEKLQALHNALDSFSGLDAAKYVFGELLSYDLTDESLPWRDWPRDLRERLVEAPQVFAYAKGFKIVYLHQSSEQLSKGTTRAIITRIMRDHANAFYGLFVVSDKDASAWELVNARLVDGKANRLNLRRVKVGTKLGVRTATERLQLVDLADQDKLTAQEIQALHDSAFDVEGISKEFYQKIAAWYFWAQGYKGVKYPRSVITDADKSIFFIRMLTRLIFCWFMRAKGLVPEELFDLKAIKTKLKDSKKDEGIYYKAILQNLFFATLNREIKDRAFLGKNDKDLDGNYNVTTLYHYAELMKKPDEILAVFKKIPFVNGGLFECLDDTQVRPEICRDDFSENEKNPLCLPDDLFFGQEREIDLSGTYGDKKHKKVSVAGLINIIKKYQFTVEENTPLDQSVALDPELLGKVFENLLASFNEETKTTARKALGAFYTPREIVDYMVDEALLAYLKSKLPYVSEDQLRGLLAYSDEPHGFSDDDVEKLIDAIDHLKALDPAVGSGAFPMGMLHKLVHILGKLDPGNEKWKERQIAKARQIEDPAICEQVIADIEAAFTNNELDYGRKLYLIQNCIYGVDIQPVAVQIAKMRFFISLLVDQKQKDDPENNYGILALPNLETNFVAANTLIGIDRPQQLSLRNPDIEKKEKELHRVRQDHFSAKTPKTKAKCREKDEKLRAEVAELLKHEGWGDKTAQMLANWNPYDQNTSSEFFDLEWMFGIEDGVDVVIGNPPYVNTKRGIEENEKKYFKANFKTAQGQFDIFCLFIEKGNQLGKIVSYIVPKPVINNENYISTRGILYSNSLHLVVIGSGIFESAGVESCIFLTNKSSKKIKVFEYENGDFKYKWDTDESVSDSLPFKMINTELNEEEFKLIAKMRENSIQFSKIFTTTRGIEGGKSDDSVTTSKTKYKLLRGEDLLPYTNIHCGYYAKMDFTNASKFKTKDLYAGEKILIRRVCNQLIASFDNDECVTLNTIYISKPLNNDFELKYIVGLLNSTALKFWFKKVFVLTDKLFPYVRISQLEYLPIKKSNSSATIIRIVDKILEAKMLKPSADISKLEKQIDEMIYKLYDLTEEEIAIIEGKDY